MFNNFKEIKLFFEQNSFAQLDLDNLRHELENRYTDKEILKGAFSLVNLELIKFQIAFFENIEKDINDVKKVLNKVLEKNIPFEKLTNNFNHLSEVIFNEKPFVDQVKNKTVTEISSIIRTTPVSILKALTKKKIEKIETDMVSEEELETISDYLIRGINKYNKRELSRQRRQKKRLLTIENSRITSPKYSNHYSKIIKCKTLKKNKVKSKKPLILEEQNKELNKIIKRYSKRKKPLTINSPFGNSVYDKLQTYGPGKIIYTRM